MEKDDSIDEEKRYKQSWVFLYLYISLIILHNVYCISELIFSIFTYLDLKHKALRIANLRDVRNNNDYNLKL